MYACIPWVVGRANVRPTHAFLELSRRAEEGTPDSMCDAHGAYLADTCAHTLQASEKAGFGVHHDAGVCAVMHVVCGDARDARRARGSVYASHT
jgi:hypothetical protein